MSARGVIAGYWAGAAVLTVAAVAGGAGASTGLGILAAITIGLAVLRQRPSRAWPWLLLSGSLLLSTAADLLYAAKAGGAADPVAGANVLYLISFIAATVGLLRFCRTDGNGQAPAGVIDALMVTVVLVLLVWVTTISPIGPAGWAMSDPALVAFPIGDALLLATAVRLLTTGRGNPAVTWLIAGAAAALVADTLYAMPAAGWSGPPSIVADVAWLGFFAAWGGAALHPGMRRLTQTETALPRALTVRRVWVVALTVLVAPAILLVEAVGGAVRDGVILAVGSAVLFLLGLARIATTANSQSRSLVFRQRQDALTGLANRAHLIERMASGPPWTAALVIDLDEFRLINDAGHAVGDEVLITVAGRLVRQVGRHDLVARVGADEFAILLGPPVRDLSVLAAELIAAISRPILVNDAPISVSACVGVAAADPAGNNAGIVGDEVASAVLGPARAGWPELLRRAGLALQAAKVAGHGEWCRYESERHGQLMERVRLREALTGAVADGAFFLQYQPIVALVTGATVGFEALARWEHPIRGTVTPAEFIGLAEETGLIVPIGDLVLRLAVTEAVAWSRTAATETYVSVNVSALQLRREGFAHQVERVLAASGLPPHLLMVELTESVLTREDDHVWVALATLRDLGVRLAIDDFGTGFSSLSYLEQTPIDVIKIDKSFVDSLVPSQRQRTVVEGIVTLAEKLGLQIVAEGVETTDARDLLIGMRCPYGQGYLYAEPLSPAEAMRWLTDPRPPTKQPAASVPAQLPPIATQPAAAPTATS